MAVDTSKINIDDVMAVVMEDGLDGGCTACGEWQYGVETDARGYKCESCGNRTVHGAGDLLLRMA